MQYKYGYLPGDQIIDQKYECLMYKSYIRCKSCTLIETPHVIFLNIMKLQFL